MATGVVKLFPVFLWQSVIVPFAPPVINEDLKLLTSFILLRPESYIPVQALHLGASDEYMIGLHVTINKPSSSKWQW